jgi:hypothetical protein
MTRDILSLMLALLLATALGARALHDARTQDGGTQPVVVPPTELTCQPIMVNGQKAVCPGPGKCNMCFPAPAPLPWKVTPKDIDSWSGNPWALGVGGR